MIQTQLTLRGHLTMINTRLEEFVSLALDAYLNADGDRNNYEHISNFELQFRRLLMRKYCNTQQEYYFTKKDTKTLLQG